METMLHPYPDDRQKIVFVELKESFETYCQCMSWRCAKMEYLVLWKALQHFVHPEYSVSKAAEFRKGYLKEVYDNLFCCRREVTFQEFYDYLEQEISF